MKHEPPIITPGYETIRSFEGNWYVAHTKARFEKALVFDLLRLGVNYFLPLKKKTYVSSGKKRKSLLPLFTSYIFLCSSDTEIKTKLFETKKIASLITVTDREKFVSELAAVEAAINSDINLVLADTIPEGKPCRVVSGAMLGTEGTVLGYKKDKARVLIEVSVLGKGVEMEVDTGMIEKV